MEQRDVLNDNAEALASLLTENVPYLLSHYLKNGVLTEAERESIISAESASAIRVKLFKTLANKDDVTLESVMDGLSATDNHSVIAEINGLLSGKGVINDDGSGDNLADVSQYANNLVDEVIAKAEKTTSQILLAKEEEKEETVVASVESVNEDEEQKEEEEVAHDEEPIKVEQKMVEVEASVEVHNSETEAVEVEKEPEKLEEPPKMESEPEPEPQVDVPDRAVSFSANVAVIDNGHEEEEEEHDEMDETPPSSPLTPPLTPSEQYQSHGLDNQQMDNDDDENIDIEKEFVMPPEATEADVTTTKVTNGGPALTRMESNDIILVDEAKTEEKNGNADKDDLDAILARKALVRQQVEKFEKTSPGGPAKVKYSFRTATPEQPEIKSESGSNVKNLKNFFQRLSTSTETQASGPVKPVGKLKVTFPAN